MRQQANTPAVIVKRRRPRPGGEGGGHGGGWKVAYADFATAMMAFFLLMWLMNATTEKQRKGIADYFNPTIPLNRVSGGGDGIFGGDSVESEDSMAHMGAGASAARPTAARMASGARSDQNEGDPAETAMLQSIAEQLDPALDARGGESMVSEALARRIVTRVTDEGLIVELYDLPDDPLFAADSTDPEPILNEFAGAVARVFGLVGNQVAVNGHVRAYPQMLREDPVWPLSQGRAEKMRELLAGAGLDGRRIQRVTGFADRKPASPALMSERNNRIEAILLRKNR